jgi:hypothetical protein
MNYEKMFPLVKNIGQIWQEIQNYEQEFDYLKGNYVEHFDDLSDKDLQKTLSKISNCEAQIKYQKNQFWNTIKQINELI